MRASALALTRDDDSLDGWMHRGQLLDQQRGVVGQPAPHSWFGFWIHGTMLKTENIAKLARDYEQALIKFERTKDAEELRQFMSKQLCEIFEGAATTGGVSARGLKSKVAEAGYDRGLVPRGVPEKYVSKADYRSDLGDIKALLTRIDDKLDGKEDKVR